MVDQAIRRAKTVPANARAGIPPERVSGGVTVVLLATTGNEGRDDAVALCIDGVTAVVDRQTLIDVLKDSTEDGDG